DILKNLKSHKNEDLLKGQAVKNQKALWDKTLEFRFLLQKVFSSSNRLPLDPVRSSFCTLDGVSEAYSDLITTSMETLDSLLELQEVLVEKNPSIAQSKDGNSGKLSKKSLEDFKNLDVQGDEEWLRISQMHKRY
ncbi:AATF-Che1 domain-containing protein, partial [Cephalotus follicularis]